MIVLDTNVLSALMRREPEPTVVAWLDLPALRVGLDDGRNGLRIRFGLEDLLPPSRRRRQLEDAFARAVTEDFGGRVLSFDQEAAREAALRAAERRTSGKPVDFRDIQIAGVVASRRATLATHNVRHFQGLGIDLVDPWASL